MAPERSPKRQKTSSDIDPTPTRAVEAPPGEGNSDSISRQPTPRASWYNSWPRKSQPVTQLVHESLASEHAAETKVRRDSMPKDRSLRSPSLAMTLGKKQTSLALPLDATTTKINAGASSPSGKIVENVEDSSHAEPTPDDKPVTNSQVDGASELQSRTISDGIKSEEVPATVASTPQRTSWLNWMGKTDNQTNSVIAQDPSTISPKFEDSSQTPASEETQARPDTSNTTAPKITGPASGTPGRKSWLPWTYDTAKSSAVTDLENPATQVQIEGSKDNQPSSSNTRSAPKSEASLPDSEQKITVPPETSTSSTTQQDDTKASAWAFWSRERKNNASSISVDTSQSGEVAITDTPSQDQPQKASVSLPKSNNANIPKPKVNAKSDKPKSETNIGKTSGTSAMTEPVKLETSEASAVAQPIDDRKQAVTAKPTKGYQNILLPELQSTLKLPEHPSIMQQLARLLTISKEPEAKHLSLVREPHRIRNALAIGVHGYFPAPLIRTVLGQPTGTSIKFADMAAKSIQRWTQARGYECHVEKAALEGEGKIAERVELLWKLLLNWIEKIRKSDFVLVACHSQGVPVAIMLVAKLIQFGCLNGARVGICAMAGVNMGPFADYRSRWISGSAGELFEFADPASKVSTDYLQALQLALNSGVHITFIGSIDDQLVSLESSIFASISHPHIYRAVSIDARAHAPNFLSHLVSFALKLRNLGIQDHGLIRELSSPLAGSLYTGEGHSRLYESENCYDLAVDWCLLTSSMSDAPLVQQTNLGGAGNPYILPFAMRGILEEEFVKNELKGETSELLQLFDDWKPTTKVLKDVKFRLEGIRSKL